MTWGCGLSCSERQWSLRNTTESPSVSDKKPQCAVFLCYMMQAWASTLVTAGTRAEGNSITLDWNVLLCILEQSRKRIRSFVSQLLDFGSVGMEILQWWRESKHWTILINVENMSECKRKWHIITLYREVPFFSYCKLLPSIWIWNVMNHWSSEVFFPLPWFQASVSCWCQDL